MRVLRPLRIAGVAAALAAALVIGCFSDHSVAGVTAGAGDCRLPDSPDIEGSTIVTISGYGFHPAELHVQRGTRVTWVNCETTAGLSHTSTAAGGAWHSSLIAPGTSFTTTFDDLGTFGYHCEPHPFMQGSVVVE
jgi:plastocyanin